MLNNKFVIPSRDRNVRPAGGSERDGRGDQRRRNVMPDRLGYGNRADRRDRGRYSMERDRRGGKPRSRSRDRFDRDRGRDGDRYGKRKEEKKDKFVGSLSEGQKPDKDTSSESDYGPSPEPVYEDEDDEEKIIEMRRKKREELLKKLAKANDQKKDSSAEPKSKNNKTHETDDDDVVLVTPSNGKGKAMPIVAEKKPAVVKQEAPINLPVIVDRSVPEDSTTPPLPPGHINKFGPAVDDANQLAGKAKEIKKNDWDMFAEQDCDSNFDVSLNITHLC